jgi:hypothetical protein
MRFRHRLLAGPSFSTAQGNKMSDRSWYFASNCQQQGPYPEAQLRDLVARGTVTADTLVWSEGMAGWQKAGEIPGLMASGGSAPPAVPQAGARPINGGAGYSGGHTAGPLSVNFEIIDFTWRTLVLLIGIILVIPLPWLLVWYIKWFVPCVSVPGRPNLGFEGNAMTIVPWFFGAVVIAIAISFIDSQALRLFETIAQFALYWLFLRWFMAKLASNGQPLGLAFSGTLWAYIGWNVLAVLAIFTIIGWAWVYTAQLRWFCRNIQGTRREVVFIGTGLEFLWRSLAAGFLSLLIIPIPWMYRWIAGWLASQTVLAERGTAAKG